MACQSPRSRLPGTRSPSIGVDPDVVQPRDSSPRGWSPLTLHTRRLVRQLCGRLPRQRRDQPWHAWRILHRPRLLQGVWHLRLRVPVRGDRDGPRRDLMNQATPVPPLVLLPGGGHASTTAVARLTSSSMESAIPSASTCEVGNGVVVAGEAEGERVTVGVDRHTDAHAVRDRYVGQQLLQLTTQGVERVARTWNVGRHRGDLALGKAACPAGPPTTPERTARTPRGM